MKVGWSDRTINEIAVGIIAFIIAVVGVNFAFIAGHMRGIADKEEKVIEKMAEWTMPKILVYKEKDMKQIESVILPDGGGVIGYLVTSEPGDMTRYEYFVHRDGPNEFTFAPTKSTFRFPQRINYWDAKVLIEQGTESWVFQNKARDFYNCNPFTLKECLDTIMLLHQDKK